MAQNHPSSAFVRGMPPKSNSMSKRVLGALSAGSGDRTEEDARVPEAQDAGSPSSCPPRPNFKHVTTTTFTKKDLDQIWGAFWRQAEFVFQEEQMLRGIVEPSASVGENPTMTSQDAQELVLDLDDSLWGVDSVDLTIAKVESVMSSALKRSKKRRRGAENKDSFHLDPLPSAEGAISNADGTVSMDAQKGRVNFEIFVDVCEHIHALLNAKTKWYLVSFPIDPESPVKQFWDLLLMVFLIFTCFAVPYQLAFETTLGHILTPYNIFDITVDCFFMTDVLVNFVTCYYHEGQYVTDIQSIGIHYMRTWFTIDVAGSFPFDKVILATGTGEYDLSSLRILKAVRMLKLIRALKLMGILSKLQEKEGWPHVKKAVSLFRAIFAMIYTAHLLGCCFTMLIDEEADQQHWRSQLNIEDEDNYHKYVAALYWACVTVTTIGYGDINPATHEERQFASFGVIAGACVFAYGMGCITSLIQQTNGVSPRFDHYVSMVQEWMDYRHIPKDTQMIVKRHLYACSRRHPSLYHEKEILDNFPSNLRAECLRAISAPGVWTSPSEIQLLSGLTDEVRGRFWTEVNYSVVDEGLNIYVMGDHGDCVYFVVDGSVELIHHRSLDPYDRVTPVDERSGATVVSEGGYFGLTSMFPQVNSRRLETARSGPSGARLITLSRDSAMYIGVEFPDFCDDLMLLAHLEHIACREDEQQDNFLSRLRIQDAPRKTEEGSKVGKTTSATTVKKRKENLSKIIMSRLKQRLDEKAVAASTSPGVPGGSTSPSKTKKWSWTGSKSMSGSGKVQLSWDSSIDAYYLIGEKEWSQLSSEQQQGSIIDSAPIPVHPSLNPLQRFQMGNQSSRVGSIRHSDALMQAQKNDGASATSPADRAGMPSPSATGGLSPLQRSSSRSILVGANPQVIKAEDAKIDKEHQFERWQLRSWAVLENGALLALPHDLDNFRNPKPVLMGYITSSSKARMVPDPVQVSVQQRRGSMSRMGTGGQDGSIFNSFGTRGFSGLTGSSLDGSKKNVSKNEREEERKGGHHPQLGGRKHSLAPSQVIPSGRHISLLTFSHLPPGSLESENDSTTITIGFETPGQQTEFMKIIEAAAKRDTELARIGSVGSGSMCEGDQAFVQKGSDETNPAGPSASSSQPETPSDLPEATFNIPPPISPVEPPDTPVKDIGISLKNRGAVPPRISTEKVTLNTELDIEIGPAAAHSPSKGHSGAGRTVKRSHPRDKTVSELAQDVAALGDDMKAVRSDVAAVAKQLEYIVSAMRHSDKGNLSFIS